MSADDTGTCLHYLVIATLQNGLERARPQFPHRITDYVHGQQWMATHGIDITQGIGRRNRSICVGIIHNRCKEVNRLNQQQVVTQLVNAGVINCVTTD